MFTVTVDCTELKTVLDLNNIINDKTKRFFADELLRWSDDYTPFKTGVLKEQAYVEAQGGNHFLVYDAPYARMLWYGKVMIMPQNGKAGFYSPTYGFWSIPKTDPNFQPKVVTERELNFTGAPQRGAFWVQRAWNEHKDEILKATEDFIYGNN